MRGFIFKSFVVFLVLCIGVMTGGYIALVKGVPRIEEIKQYMPARGTLVYADDDTLIGEFKVEKGVYVPITDMPEYLLRAIVAVEDSKFWLHRGIDYVAVIRAITQDIKAGRIKQGASTITQQLAKVVFLSPEKTIIRKLKEATLAMRIEQNLTKEEILELYLNKIYFGHGAYGVEMAARTYFGKPIQDITLAEAALIAGLVKAPSRFSPYANLDLARKRQHIVLIRMVGEGYINQGQADAEYAKPLYLTSARYERFKPNYFLEYIRKYLEDEYGVETTYKGGLKVYTTLNKNIQAAAESSLKWGLRQLDKRQGYRGALDHKKIDVNKELKEKESFSGVVMKKGDLMTATVLKTSSTEAIVKTRGVIGRLFSKDAKWARKLIDTEGNVVTKLKQAKISSIMKPGDTIHVRVKDASGKEPVFALEQEPLVQGAVVAMEPSTGYIRAIVGGYDFKKSEFNRAVNARRQAGSVFKPVTYAAAMDYGFTPASLIPDEPIIYESEEFGDWEPENYDEKYHGATRLREGLAHSRNIATVKLLEEVGVQRVVRLSRALGITGPFPYNLTLSLGSISISPLEITSAFSVFANKGVRMDPIAIKYIIDEDGNVVENNRPKGVTAISPQTAFLATSMLEEVVKSGTGWRARALRRPVAGKTGTTNEYKDAWFVGYTTDLVAGVWVGYDNARTMGDKETGSKAAAPVWVSFMKKALAEISPFGGRNLSAGQKKAFEIPDGIVTATIDPLTGLLAAGESEKMVEFFKEGTVPTEYSEPFYRDLVRQQKEAMLKIEKKKDEDNEESRDKPGRVVVE